MSALEEDLVPVVILTVHNETYELTPNEYLVWLQTGKVSGDKLPRESKD